MARVYNKSIPLNQVYKSTISNVFNSEQIVYVNPNSLMAFWNVLSNINKEEDSQTSPSCKIIQQMDNIHFTNTTI